MVKVVLKGFGGPLLLEPSHHLTECYDGRLTVGESLVQVSSKGHAKVLLTNTLASAFKLDKADWLALAFEAKLVTNNNNLRDTSKSAERDTNKKYNKDDLYKL